MEGLPVPLDTSLDIAYITCHRYSLEHSHTCLQRRLEGHVITKEKG